MKLPLLLCLAVALLSGGCTVGPDYQKPEMESPDAWNAAEGPSVSSRPADLRSWWSHFNDKVLDSLVERTVPANLDLKIAASRVREARALRSVAASAYYPQVGTSASYSRQRISENGVISQGGGGPVSGVNIPDFDTYTAGVDVAWEIDVFGHTRRSVEAADADLQAVIEDRNAVLLSLLAEVARNYVLVRGSQRSLAITRENLRSQEQTLELIRARVAAGFSSDLDSSRALAQTESTRALIPPLETDLKQSIHRLSVLLATPPATLMSELMPDAAIPAPPGSIELGVPSELLRRRPDLRRAERHLAATNARIGVAVAEKYPRFSILGNAGYRSITASDFPDANSLFFAVIPGVSLPIFTGGRLDANVEAAKARDEQALLVLKQTFLIALEETENSLVSYVRQQDRRRALAASVTASRRAFDLANELYTRGLIDFLDVLETQRTLLLNEEQLAFSERQVTLAAIDVYRALGGGWEIEVPQETEAPAAAPL